MLSLQIFALVFFLAASAFFSGMETGIIATNRLRLQHQVRRHVPGAATIRWFLAHPDVLLAATLLGTNLCHVAATILAAAIGHALGGIPGATAAGVLMTLVVLVCCEYLPKSFFQASPATRVLPLAPLLRLAAWILSPAIWAFNALFRLLSRAPRSDPDAEKLLVTREDLQYLSREGVQSGVLTPHEIEMIHGVFALNRKTCASIMVPRDKMIAAPADATAADLMDLARRHAVNRFPVYDPAKKEYTGVVHIFDVLSDPDPAGKRVADYARPPQFVASYMPVDHLLPRMRVTRLPLFLVTDERYEVVGLVTLEDVLQEIVGE